MDRGSHHQNQLVDTNFSCPCELCDCGCFEATHQPHSFNCTRLKSQSEVVFSNANKESEYGLSFKNQDQYKQPSIRIPDSFSFDKRSLINNETKSVSKFDSSFEDTSYRNYFSYPAVEKQPLSSVLPPVSYTQPQESKSNPIARLKQEYLKSFDELNSGFNDSFTQSKGKATFINEYDAQPLEPQRKEQRQIHEEVRNLYVPKKYPGRNMFKSHIDSAIFPEKNANLYETQYARNSIQATNRAPSARRSNVNITGNIAENVVAKNMGYLRLIDNSFIPLIKMVNPKTLNSSLNEKSLTSFQGESPRSTYMTDFDKQLKENSDRKCRYMAYKLATQRDKALGIDYEDKQRQTLYELRRRQNELAQREYNIKI